MWVALLQALEFCTEQKASEEYKQAYTLLPDVPSGVES